jgi:hypothetical protein
MATTFGNKDRPGQQAQFPRTIPAETKTLISDALMDPALPLAQVSNQMTAYLNAISARMDTVQAGFTDLNGKSSALQGVTVAMRAELTKLQQDDLPKLKAEVAAIKAEPSPIGTVISSLLTEAEISGMTGVWVLCDGRNVAGTAYATLTKRNTVPDLRGSFLRGAGTRTGVTGWAGGTVNTHVEDSTRLPRTDFTVTSRDPIRQGDSGRGIAGSASYAAGEAYLRPGLNTNRVDGGDPETRPKHFVVNFFVRVD